MAAETVRGGAVAEAFAGAEVEHCLRGLLGGSEPVRAIGEFGGLFWGGFVSVSLCGSLYMIEVYLLTWGASGLGRSYRWVATGDLWWFFFVGVWGLGGGTKSIMLFLIGMVESGDGKPLCR